MFVELDLDFTDPLDLELGRERDPPSLLAVISMLLPYRVPGVLSVTRGPSAKIDHCHLPIRVARIGGRAGRSV